MGRSPLSLLIEQNQNIAKERQAFVSRFLHLLFSLRNRVASAKEASKEGELQQLLNP